MTWQTDFTAAVAILTPRIIVTAELAARDIDPVSPSLVIDLDRWGSGTIDSVTELGSGLQISKLAGGFVFEARVEVMPIFKFGRPIPALPM